MWLTSLQPLWDEWDRQWARWEVKDPDPNLNPYLSQVQAPWGMHAVEVILPRILGDNPQMAYKALNDEDDEPMACLMGKIVTAEMAQMGFNYECRDIIRQALVCGYTIGKVGWVRTLREEHYENSETHPMIDGSPQYGNVQVRVPGRRTVVVKNRPFLEYVNLKDFVWPIASKNLDAAPAVWQRRWVTLGHIRQRGAEGVYQNTDEVTGMDSARFVEAYSHQFADQGLTPNVLLGVPDMDDDRAMVELWERWEDDRLTVIANRRVPLRDQENPFDHKRKPFVDYTPIPRPSQLHGLGIMRITESLNEHLNTVLRQTCDATTYTLAPMFKHTSGVDWENVVIEPGGRISVPDTEDVEPLVMPTVDFAAAGQTRQFLIEEMTRVSGAFEYIGGAFPIQGSRTATGVTTIIQEGEKRITEMLSVFNYRFMLRFGSLMQSMNLQYLDEAYVVDVSDDPKALQAFEEARRYQAQDVGLLSRLRRVVNRDDQSPKMVRISADMLRCNGELEPMPEVGQDKALSDTQKRNDWAQFMSSIAPILASGQNPANMAALLRIGAKVFGIPEEEIQQIAVPDPTQQLARQTDAAGNGGVPSGPGGGDNLPSGLSRGALGAAGPIGPPQS